MEYFGLQSQIRRNNTNSVLILLLFPIIFAGLTWLFFFLLYLSQNRNPGDAVDQYGLLPMVNTGFIHTIPFVTIGVLIWFSVAWFSHSTMIKKATGSKPLERKENLRVYNLVENLCISKGMKMPMINIIEDDSLNAFASGLDEKTYTVSLSRGIMNKLDDHELEAVIAHELTHIRNRDVRLLIISIVFVGIFAFLSEALFRSMRFGSLGRGKKGGAGAAVLIGIVIALLGYLIASLLRFSLSRKREFLADAGSAELTRNPLALASALRKISADPTIEAVERKDVAQMFIENPQIGNKKFSVTTSLFATHPPIQKRIEILEQF